MTLYVREITGNYNHLHRRMERKFYIAPARVEFACGLLHHVCCPAAEYPCEQINSLYFDTPDLDQHHRSLAGDYRKDKVRIRWYGEIENCRQPQQIFIELKSREGFSSFKQRRPMQVMPEALDLYNLHKGIIAHSLLQDILSEFGYFPVAPLLPIISISYLRYRFTDVFSGQGVALDSRIRSTLIVRDLGNGEKELELPGAVLEVKGTTMELPATLQNIRLLRVDWSRYSKYSSCIEAHLGTPGATGRLSPSGKLINV